MPSNETWIQSELSINKYYLIFVFQRNSGEIVVYLQLREK